MISTLQSGRLAAAVSTRGAELMHLCDERGTERLWQGAPAVWDRRAPLLFPFIGRLKDERYTVDGTPYHIPIHGFAPESEFTAVSASQDALHLRLTDTPQTRAQYPFPFVLDVLFALSENQLTKTFRMTNPGDRPLWYELGGHEGYRTAIAPGETTADAYIQCTGETALHPFVSDSRLFLLPEKRTIPLTDGRLALRPGLFAQDALILDDLHTRTLTLVQGHGTIRVDFPDFPYVGIWSHPTIPSDYVCLEPWSSLPDFHAPGTELSEKWGVRRLEAGASETLSYTITVSC